MDFPACYLSLPDVYRGYPYLTKHWFSINLPRSMTYHPPKAPESNVPPLACLCVSSPVVSSSLPSLFFRVTTTNWGTKKKYATWKHWGIHPGSSKDGTWEYVHLLEKEKHLNQTIMFRFKLLIFSGCILYILWIFCRDDFFLQTLRGTK